MWPTVRIVQLPSVLLILAFVGCSRKTDTEPPSSNELAAMRLSRLGFWYASFLGQNKGKPPRTISQLREYGQSRITPEQLTALGVSDVGQLFLSPRDNEPFAMVPYNKVPVSSGDPVVVFYEQKGQDGTRCVALLGGGSLALDDESLQKLVPAFKRR